MNSEMKPSSLLPRPVTLISGYRGLAETLIERLQRNGFPLSVAVRNSKKIAELKDRFPQVQWVGAELSNPKDCDRWIDTALSQFGQIGALVNNAAVPGPAGKLHENSFEEWEQAFRINFLAPTYLCHKIIPLLLRNNVGTIINLSGGGATNPRPQFSSYATAKTAIVRLTETLAKEYPNLGIYAVAPGSLMTPMIEKLGQHPDVRLGNEASEIRRRLIQGGDNPNRAADLIEWLLLEKPKALSGKLISAIWDDYKNIPPSPEKLGWWTLRRIDEIAKKNILEYSEPANETRKDFSTQPTV